MIQEYLLSDESGFVSNIPNFVKSTEDDILKSCQIPELRRASTGAMTISNRFVTLPTDFIAPYSLSVISSNVHYTLLQKDDNFLYEAYPNTATTGRPAYYAILDDDSLIVAPIPDSGYTIQLLYFYKPVSIVTTSTSWIGDNAPNALLYGSLLHGALYLKQDQDMITYYKQRFDEAIMGLQILTEGRIRKDVYRKENKKLEV